VRPNVAISLITPLIVVSVFFAPQAWAESKPAVPSPEEKLTLVTAVMCERITGNEPQGQSIVFSASLGNVFCFTHFDPVPEKSYIYHHWFFREELKAKRRLSVKPPEWSTVTKIRVQEKDKGPWRVEITDEKGRNLSTLRFSIVD